MSKFHPTVIEDTGAKQRSGRKLEEKIGDLISKISADDDRRDEWLERQRSYYLRRYVRLGRGTNWPWPGAADIVMPTIDMTIDRLKSTIARVIFTRPLVVFEANSQVFSQQARDDEKFFNWLLLHHVPDFKRQMVIAIDSMLQFGFAVTKVFWDYRTRRRKKILNLQDLPRRYGAALPFILRRLSNTLFQQEPTLISGRVEPELKQRLASETIETLRLAIARDFNLDPEEDDDKRALDRIVSAAKQRKERVEYKTREVEANFPRLVTIDPQDVIVPGNTTDLDEAERVTHRLWLTKSAFMQHVRDLGWSKTVAKDILGKDGQALADPARTVRRELLDFERDQREGLLQTSPDDLIEVWETHYLDDIDGDGTPERVFTVIHPASGRLLKDPREEPYDHGFHPFIQIPFELNDGRFYSSRGVPEKIDDIDREITLRHRNKLNNMDMMVPTFTYRFGSNINPESFQFRPGNMFPVVEQDDVTPLPVPDRTIPDEREENILLTWNQRYLGGLDTGLSDQANISEARTATEIQAIQRSASETLSFRGDLVQIGMKKVYDRFWDLWNQWGPEEIYMRVTGKPFRRKTPREIRDDTSIVPIGTVQTTDPELEKVRARERLLLMLQLLQANGGNPIVDGTHRINIAEALVRWFQRENLNDARAIVEELSPQEKQLVAQQAALRQRKREALEDNEPMSLPDLRQAVREIKSDAPNKGRQRIRVG